MRRKQLLYPFVAGILLLGIFYLLGRPEHYDVLVIGAGAAGLSAALEAEAEGASVLVIEKMPTIGGNTMRATGGMNAAESAVQEKLGIEDSTRAHLKDTLNAGHRKSNPVLAGILVDQAKEAVHRLRALGADLEDVGYLAGHSAPRTHRPTGGAPVGTEIIRVLKDSLKARDIPIRLETRIIGLIRKGETVRGALVRDKTGREYRIFSTALVLAIGGYGGSPRTFVRYDPALAGFNTTNHPGATGDYIPLAEKIGARLLDMEQIQAHPTVEPDHGILITEALRGNGGILVDLIGRRFTDELAFRDVLSAKILESRGGLAFLIFDENVRRSLSASEDYIRRRLVVSANTPRELAQKLGIDPPLFSAELETYNTVHRSGKADPFGRSGLSIPLETPPYYGIKVSPGVHYCMGGLAIDEKTRVLRDSDGKPIPGLYAAGEATGGIHGKNRLGGNSLADAVIFGRIAGKEAAKR
jgi:fumarate reductase flavoprotein subunit